MALWSRMARGALSALLAPSLLLGCSSRADSSGPVPGPLAPINQGNSEAGTSGAGVQLVDVDPNQTFAPPQGGQGVGVFTQYMSGGHWNIQWTCDSAITSLPCTFQIGVSVTTGAIGNVSSQLAMQGDQVEQPAPARLNATANTTTSVDGLVFDTVPGAVVTLSAQINGELSGAILFFIQDGKVNGGYQGPFDDPLMFEPSSP